MKQESKGFPDAMRECVRKPWQLAALALLAALFLISVYRAATQSITHDEGVIYEWLLSGSWSRVLTFEHGNHHVVSDLLCKLMISVFGLSDISLRIPSLLGGLLYFYAVFRISKLLFGEAFLFLLSVAFLSLNPFVLDYLVCARGYGLALGFFLYALFLLTHYLVDAPDRLGTRPARLLNWAGIALGLSIGSNVIMVFPSAALVASLLVILIGSSLMGKPEPEHETSVQHKPRESRKKRRERSRHKMLPDPRVRSAAQAFLHFVLPAVAVGGVISILPSRLIELEPGYMGPPSLRAILEVLVRFSLFHSPVGFAGLAARLDANSVVLAFTRIVLPLGLAGLLAVTIRIVVLWARKHSFDALRPIDRFLLFIIGVLGLTVLLVVLSRYGFGQPYPEMRTAMYWIPLASLAFLGILKRFADGAVPRPAVSIVLGIIVVAVTVQYVSQFNTRYFAEWAYCAAGKDMMQAIRTDHAQKPRTDLKIGATWQLEPVINFYRVEWGLDWMNPVHRQNPEGVFDYYMLGMGDTSLAERMHLKVLRRDFLSGTVLAKSAAD